MRFLPLSVLFLSSIFSTAQEMPLDFDDQRDQFIGFSGSTFSVITDPDDADNDVGRFENNGEIAQGFFLDLNRPIDLSTNQRIDFQFYSIDNNSHTVLVKLERGNAPDVEVQTTTSAAANSWQELSVDFSNAQYSNGSGVVNANGSYNRITLFINIGENTAGTYYLDDIIDGSTVSDPDPDPVDVVYDRLVWSDEFDSTSKDAIDSNKWFHQTQLPAGGSWYNGEIQHYTDRIENSYVENGFLHIVAQRERFTDQNQTKDFTSARLNSKFAFTYGRVDVRAKLPSGEGTWPAIWTLGKNINEDGGFWDEQYGTANWPACGEIDIMEHGLGQTNHVSSALHTPCDQCSGNTKNFKSTVLSDVSENFHVYSVNWSPEKIVFMIDGDPFYTYNPTVKDAGTWPFDADQYLLLNVALGGISGAVEPSFSRGEMMIDYVRVYQESTASIDDLDVMTVKLYPNPASNSVQVKANAELTTIELYNIAGSRINTTIENSSIDVSNLSSGLYFIRVVSQQGSQVLELIVE
ncbi:glycosyl hydrolase family protein [Nonlabens ponticola]|uniref:Glycosyl hydrolase family protein n=2 Tax=Nonlabens ponticola TaxID=2496866 RepID=A0A3S9N1E8_9FLAO|nr:glycosyl hydrolase family protein [Nonlabens ponticola]